MVNNIGANIKFGDCLNYLLNTLDISINRLSKAINVDSSLVNRWIHEKRLPSYNTTYIERISEYLSKNIHNTFQVQRINNLLIKFGEEIINIEDVKPKIQKVLSESQGYSIELRSERKEYKTLKKKEVLFAENNVKQCCKCENNIISFDDNSLNNPYIELSCEDRIVWGSKNILAAVILLLESAASKKCNNNKTIYLSFNNDVDLGKNQFPYLDQIKGILLKAINNGWNILFLLRLNNNIKRTIKILEFSKPLLKAGNFVPYYIRKYDIFTLGKENIIVPDFGAMSCYSTIPYSDINHVFFLKNKIAIDILQQNFNSIIKALAHPLVNNFSKDNFKDYSSLLLRYENCIGKRLIYEYGFNTMTIPENLFKKFLKRLNFSEKNIKEEIAFYKNRQTALELNIVNFEYRDLYSIDSVNMLINSRQLYIYTTRGVELINLDINEIIEIIQNIIGLLRKYENYNIAFINNCEKNSSRDDYCIYVKERQGVLFACFDSTKSTTEINLAADEPMLVKAIIEYYKEVWDHISPVNKEKNEIILWLQSHIDILKKAKN